MRPKQKSFNEWTSDFFHLFVKKSPSVTSRPYPINHKTYLSDLSINTNNQTPTKPIDVDKAKRAYEMVVRTREFEIEMYWKRATYFWAFIVSIFAAYVALQKEGSSISIFAIIVLGFIISVAWHLSNLGSKQWQRHWEKHLDLLEDNFTGPLYKTVFFTKTYSVSKLNNIVSFSIVVVWLVLGIDHLEKSKLLSFFAEETKVAWSVWILIISAIFALVSMFFGYGRGRFGMQEASMYRRRLKYDGVELPTTATAAASAAAREPAASATAAR